MYGITSNSWNLRKNKENSIGHCLTYLFPEADSSSQWKQPSLYGALRAVHISLQQAYALALDSKWKPEKQLGFCGN